MGKRAAEIVRTAPVQAADKVPPKSLARDTAFCKVTVEDFACSGGGAGCEVTWRHAPGTTGHHAKCGRTWHWHVLDSHAQVTDRTAQNAQWRMATALPLGATPDAGPRSTCALRKGNDGDMVEKSLATHPFHPFCCKYGRAKARPHRAVQHTLRRLIEQAGASRTWNAMSLSSTTG